MLKGSRRSPACSCSWAERSSRSTTSAERTRRLDTGASLALVLLCFIAYGLTLNAWFQEDDFVLLRRVSLGGPFGTWSHGPNQFFRPLISFSLWVQQATTGFDPLPFRIFNVAVHAGVCVVVYRLLRDFAVTLPMAVAIAAVFAVHPSHAEPVMWIASRTDLVATLLGLWGLLLFVQGRVGWSAAAFFVGLLAKESLVVLPLILAAYVYFFRPSFSWRQAGWFGAAFAAYLALRLVLVGPALDNGLTRSGGIKLVGTTLIQIVRTFLPGLPIGDSALNNSEAIMSFAGIGTLLVGLLVIAVALRRSVYLGPHSENGLQAVPEKAALRRFLLAAFVISLLPAAGLAVRLFRAQGERFLYLPSVFLLTWLLLGLFGANYRRVAWVAAGGFLLLQFQGIFWRQGAEVAHRVDLAVARDIVPRLSPETRRIALLNAPVRVQGSYGVFYVLGEIARNHGANPLLEVEVSTALQLYRGSHSVTRQGLTLSIAPEEGGFLPEETFGTQSPSPEELRQRGLTGLRRTQANFAPPDPKTPTFWWDGSRFILL